MLKKKKAEACCWKSQRCTAIEQTWKQEKALKNKISVKTLSEHKVKNKGFSDHT